MTDGKSEIVISPEILDFEQLELNSKLTVEVADGINIDGTVTRTVHNYIYVRFPTWNDMTKILMYEGKGCFVGLSERDDGDNFAWEWTKVRIFAAPS